MTKENIGDDMKKVGFTEISMRMTESENRRLKTHETFDANRKLGRDAHHFVKAHGYDTGSEIDFTDEDGIPHNIKGTLGKFLKGTLRFIVKDSPTITRISTVTLMKLIILNSPENSEADENIERQQETDSTL